MQATLLPTPSDPARQAGFSLTELVVACGVLAILLSIGVTSFASWLNPWRRDAAIEAFTSDMRLARSTATRHSRPVVVCAHAGGHQCGTRNDWAAGWLVFTDLNANNRLDAEDTQIVRRGAQAGITSMTSNGSSPARIAFRTNGTVNGLSRTLTVQPPGGDAVAREIVINPLGRVHVQAPRK